ASGVPSPYPPRTYIHYAIRDTEFLFWDSACLRAVAACGRREGTRARAEDGEGATRLIFDRVPIRLGYVHGAFLSPGRGDHI
ncbi:hypothetical protein BaRGS_00039438, partial [Batillaria attramentaria]